MWWEWMYSCTHSWTLALREVNVNHHTPFVYLRERAIGTPWRGGWVGSDVELNVLEDMNLSRPYRESNHYFSIVQAIVYFMISGLLTFSWSVTLASHVYVTIRFIAFFNCLVPAVFVSYSLWQWEYMITSGHTRRPCFRCRSVYLCKH